MALDLRMVVAAEGAVWRHVVRRLLRRGVAALGRLRWARVIAGDRFGGVAPWQERRRLLLVCAWVFRWECDRQTRVRGERLRLAAVDAATSGIGVWAIIVKSPVSRLKLPGGSGASAYLQLAGTSVAMCRCLAFAWARLLHHLAPLYDTATWPLARRLPALERTRFVMAKRIVKKHSQSSSDCQAGSNIANIQLIPGE